MPLMVESGISSTDLLLLAAIVVAIITVLNMRRRRRPLDGSPKQYRREIDSATAQSSAVKRNMEQLLIELEELSRNINAQIDTKFAKLERSIVDADKRISALRILIDEARRVGGGSGDRSEGPGEQLGGGEAAARPSADAPLEPPDEQRGGAGRRPDERYQRIYELADRGLSPVQISQEVGQETGEVELILNLRNSAGEPGSSD
jgi:hypothetical protein